MDFGNYEKMKRECPSAARFWRVGDRLYYLGLISIIVSALLLAGFRAPIYVIALAGSVGGLVLGIYLKRRSYEIAREAGCRF